jgi:hypothetical protein
MYNAELCWTMFVMYYTFQVQNLSWTTLTATQTNTFAAIFFFFGILEKRGTYVTELCPGTPRLIVQISLTPQRTLLRRSGRRIFEVFLLTPFI